MVGAPMFVPVNSTLMTTSLRLGLPRFGGQLDLPPKRVSPVSCDPYGNAEQLELEFPSASDRGPRRESSAHDWGTARQQGRPEVTNKALPVDDGGLGHLYSIPMPSRRSGPLYNAFSYPTKIDPEAIALFIAAHTSPGDTVLDVFAGSGTTGIAARLCENPTAEMRHRAEELGLPVEWGARHAVLYELGVIGSMLANTMCDPPDPAAFASAANRVVTATADRYGWMYAAEGPNGSPGSLRHAIWTDVIECSSCSTASTYWDVAVEREPLSLKKVAQCSSCGASISTSSARRATETVFDPLTDSDALQRTRRLAHVYGRTGRTSWQRAPLSSDLELVERVLDVDIPKCAPTSEVQWGDLHRTGYHQGISRFQHFYTRRNLIALAGLWEAIDAEDLALRDALRLLVLSYNATHSTLMTRIVVKTGMSDFVLTGAQSGVLYVSSLPVEKNVLEGVRRKIETFRLAFATSFGGSSTVRVVNGSSTELDLPDDSIDYVFTDPPFGGFIPYAEINQINEAWLGNLTDATEEVIVSPAQRKGVSEYAGLMKRVFGEVVRVMKPDAAATVVFHSSKPDVWSALGDAFTSAGLVVERTSVLDKTQVSFKQVVSEGSTRGDAIFLLAKTSHTVGAGADDDLNTTILELRERHGDDLSPQHLYSRYVAQCVDLGRTVALNSRDFYERVRSLKVGRT